MVDTKLREITYTATRYVVDPEATTLTTDKQKIDWGPFKDWDCPEDEAYDDLP